MKLLMALAVFAGLFGLDRSAGQASDAGKTGVTITDEPNDAPEFKRIYVKYVYPRNVKIKITVTIHTFSGTRMTQGELTQSDGKWVLFEPERPADKIIDPVLLPMVNEACKVILQIDHDFIRNYPKKFTDSAGHTSVRQ